MRQRRSPSATTSASGIGATFGLALLFLGLAIAQMVTPPTGIFGDTQWHFRFQFNWQFAVCLVLLIIVVVEVVARLAASSRNPRSSLPVAPPLPPPPVPAAEPPGALRSPDGQWWWDGQAWHPVRH